MKLKPLAFFIITTLAYLSSFSQSDSTKQKREPKFYLTSYLGYYVPSGIKADLVKPKLSWSIPISFMRRLPVSKKIEFGVGISGRMIATKFKDYSLTFQSDIDATTGIDYNNSWQKVTSRNYYAGVPVSLRYIISKTGNLHYLGLSCDALYATHSIAKMKVFESGALNSKVKAKYPQGSYLFVPRVEIAVKFKMFKFSHHAVLFAERTINKLNIHYLSPNSSLTTDVTIFGLSLSSSPPKRR